MADVSLPGDTGAFTMDLEESHHEGFDEIEDIDEEGQRQNLRRLRDEQSKSRRSARDRSRAVRRQVCVVVGRDRFTMTYALKAGLL